MNQTNIVHVIPGDDGIDSNIAKKTCETSVKHNENLDVFDQGINEILKSRRLLCASAAALIKHESTSVSNRLKDYQSRVHKRHRHSIIRKRRVLEQSKITAMTNSDFSSQLRVARTEFCSLDECPVASDTTLDMTDMHSMNQNFVLSDLQEKESIWNQAKRMKRMTMLVRSIEKTQQLLIHEILECRHAALQEIQRIS